jgi:branched-chain amino acid transport system substrate-binding protein
MPMLTTSQRQARSVRLGRARLVAVAVTVALVVMGCSSGSKKSATASTSPAASAASTSSAPSGAGTSSASAPSATESAPAASATASGGATGAVTDYVAYTGGTAGAADSSKSPVTIGWVNQQGGPLGFPAATDGAQAAVKYVNSHLGGIGGHPLALSTCFVAANETEGNACGLKLVNDSNVKAVLYGTLFAGNQSFQAVNKGQKPVLMGNSINPVDSSAQNVYIYDGNPSSIFGGLASYVASVLKAKKVSVIYPQDAQSSAGVATLKKALDSVNVALTAVGFDPSSTNLTSAAVAAGAQTADVVIPLVSTPPACIAAAKALGSLGIKAPIVATGAFCFSPPVAQGLGGAAPNWQQLSTQTNVADSSQPDVKAYLDASTGAGLSAASQGTSDAALAWGLVLTAARFVNAAGGANATPTTVATAAKAFTGPMLLGSANIKCGSYPTQPGLCGAQTRVFEHTGGANFKALTDWIPPVGM